MPVEVYHLERNIFCNILVMSEKNRQLCDKKLINLYYDVTCPLNEGSQIEGCKILFDYGYYSHTATVITRDIVEAFILTQNLKGPWCDNPRVCIKGHSMRSTCIGDLIKHVNLHYLVTLLGIKPIHIF